MKLKKLNLAIITALAGTNVAIAEEASPVTANIGVVSNYMFRGVTQTDDGPAIQGGVDYAESGFSLGTWVSNVDFNLGTATEPKYEWDVYAGYGEKLDDFGYNVTLSYFAYPDGKDSDLAEVGASGSWDFLTLGLAYTFYGQATEPAAFRDGDLYYYGNLGFDLPVNFRLSGTLGYYNFNDLDKDEGDYMHWQVSLSKSAGDFGTFSLNYDQNDGGTYVVDTKEYEVVAKDDDPKISIGWKKTF